MLGLFDFAVKKDTNSLDNEDTTKSDKLFWSIALIPDILYLLSYGILFWQLFKLFLEGHIHLSSTTNVPWIRNKGLGYRILIILLISYLILETLMTILYLTRTVRYDSFQLELSIVITIVCSFVLIFLFFLSIKFSGQPYLNEEYRKKIRALTAVVSIWSLLKIVRAIFGYFNENGNNFMIRVLAGLNFGNNDKWQSLQLIIIFLV